MYGGVQKRWELPSSRSSSIFLFYLLVLLDSACVAEVVEFFVTVSCTLLLARSLVHHQLAL